MPLPCLRHLRLISLLLCVCVLFNSTMFAAVPLDAATVKQQIQSHGVSSVVRLSRKDGGELKGRIVSIGEDSCVLQVKKQPAPVTVAFADVTKVKGPGLSTGAKVGIIAGVCVVAAVGIAAIIFDHNFKFPKTIPI